MKGKKILLLVVVCACILSLAGPGFSHKEEEGRVQGTLTKIEATEYELTVKDDKGRETKVLVKDAGGFKVGEHVIIKDGKVTKVVKPVTGGY